ncbi:MAG: PEP/pyruvate-binding domain-containing protein [Bacillota bacterium]
MDDRTGEAGNLPGGNLLDDLKEREKELNCLYMVDEILGNQQLSISELFEGIIRVLPSGFRFPELCQAKIVYNNQCYKTPGFIDSPISKTYAVKADGKDIGLIQVVYTKTVPKTEEGYFLEKERMLIRAVADRIGQMIIYRQMKSVLNGWELAKTQKSDKGDESGHHEWQVIIDFLRQSDHESLAYICRNLTNYLLIIGIKEASDVFSSPSDDSELSETGYANFPARIKPAEGIEIIAERVFRIAEKYLAGVEISALVKRWIQEKSYYSLIRAIGSIAPSLRNIIEEIRKLRDTVKNDELLYSPKERLINVGLITGLLCDKPDFVNVAKQYISLRDFFDIINRIIFPINSRGKLGGKSTGLFLAQKILAKEIENSGLADPVKVPKTWYITTDAMTEFLQYNNLEELNEQKYKDLQEIRIEYPNIVRLIKSAKLPPEILRGLSVALDDFGENPLIVRSSSTLEDQSGAAFSGKYKSLFLANQGTKKERLEALEDAILEVYASVFSPDPNQYRIEKGLIDLHEEMGIMIQEVVGKRAGKYFFPLFSGVAFSNNEYRWSPRIKREDGLIRMVPGLGTRAVDRLSDDFPIMLSPGQPGIKVNIVPEEIRRYSPKKIDVINLESRSFETVDIADLLKECGDQVQDIHKIVSKMEYDHIVKPNKFEIDFKKDDLVVTFDGIISDTRFIKQIGRILKTLKEKTGMPVDIEFVSDGDDLYLLQCRPQSYSEENVPAPIPKDVSAKDIIFSAKRFVSNGLIQNISHIVYVDPDEYSSITALEDLKAVGRVVGRLNAVLPKRQFILMGPGRWGSRGDIKLGVSVSYSDICNTAALIEIAVKKTGYMPELSFGTHFFQDLVESNIRYLPLYPYDEGVIFNSTFLTRSPNILGEIFPEYEKYQDVIRVINVPGSTGGLLLNIAMNGDLGEALGYLSSHPVAVEIAKDIKPIEYDDFRVDENSWRWRYYMAEQIAAKLDPQLYGVKALYLIGSTSNGTANPGSDIDLLVHFQGTPEQKASLMNWLNGWSLCLAETNYLKTGYRMDGMLDVHIITDEDIRKKTSFAIKIDNITEPAQQLKLKQ